MQVLHGLDQAQEQFDSVLTTMSGFSDAGAVRINESSILLQTVDLITPLVDDPAFFGAIAATNALSDIYAMGGKPVAALNILCYPSNVVAEEVVNTILMRSLEKLHEAGAVLVGGHTIDSPELIYGMSVTGLVTEKLINNANAQVGDLLVLTKPLGNSIVAVSYSQNPALVSEAEYEAAVNQMTQLNRHASEAAQRIGISACTDITGFGFLGHLWELCTASDVAVDINMSAIVAAPGSLSQIERGHKSSVWEKNREHMLLSHAIQPRLLSNDTALVNLLLEGETSGGLLMSVHPDSAAELVKQIRSTKGGEPAHVVGQVLAGPPAINLH